MWLGGDCLFSYSKKLEKIESKAKSRIDKMSDEDILKNYKKLYFKYNILAIIGILCFIGCILAILVTVNS